jgi:hypothetical protein
MGSLQVTMGLHMDGFTAPCGIPVQTAEHRGIRDAATKAQTEMVDYRFNDNRPWDGDPRRRDLDRFDAHSLPIATAGRRFVKGWPVLP